MERDKILIIDDEKDFLSMLESVLKDNGYEVIAASDGEEGLKKAKARKPDLVICDIKMPKRDGYSVLKGIRHEVDKDLPFIMLTAVKDFKDVEEAYEDGADFYVSKPVEIVTLLKNVRTLLNLRRDKRA